MPSARARKALASDLESRYHSEWYGGTKVIRKIISEVGKTACRVFRCRNAIVTPLSGNLCDLGMILAFTRPGDSVAMMPISSGGYPLDVGLFGRKRVDLPVKPGTYEIDETRLSAAPRANLVIAGSSFIPFPHPVREMKKAGSRLVFDGSHVLGLIATGRFQDPLIEGAEVLFGSTHKSLYGPQGGIVLTNDPKLHSRLSEVLDFGMEGLIGLVDNPHPGRIAALGLTLEEIRADRGYGGRVIANARALGAALEKSGVPVRFSSRGYTESHQVFLDIDLETGKRLSALLERKGVFVDVAGRLGTAEVTRRGMSEGDMEDVALRIAKAFRAVRRN